MDGEACDRGKGNDWSLTLPQRFLIAGRAPWFYLGKLLWPEPLMFFYPRWHLDAGAWWQWLFPAALAGSMALLWIARRRIGKAPLAAMAFFVITLFPALGFVDVYPFRYSFVADHFQYLASIGPIALMAAGITGGRRFSCEKKMDGNRGVLRTVARAASDAGGADMAAGMDVRRPGNFSTKRSSPGTRGAGWLTITLHSSDSGKRA